MRAKGGPGLGLLERKTVLPDRSGYNGRDADDVPIAYDLEVGKQRGFD